MLKAVHAQEDRAAVRQKAEQVAAKLQEMKLADAAAIVLAEIVRSARARTDCERVSPELFV